VWSLLENRNFEFFENFLKIFWSGVVVCGRFGGIFGLGGCVFRKPKKHECFRNFRKIGSKKNEQWRWWSYFSKNFGGVVFLRKFLDNGGGHPLQLEIFSKIPQKPEFSTPTPSALTPHTHLGVGGGGLLSLDCKSQFFAIFPDKKSEIRDWKNLLVSPTPPVHEVESFSNHLL